MEDFLCSHWKIFQTQQATIMHERAKFMLAFCNKTSTGGRPQITPCPCAYANPLLYAFAILTSCRQLMKT